MSDLAAPRKPGAASGLALFGNGHAGQADAVQRTWGEMAYALPVSDQDAVLEAQVLERLTRVTPRTRDELYGDASSSVVGRSAGSGSSALMSMIPATVEVSAVNRKRVACRTHSRAVGRAALVRRSSR